jgi:hypothetical protein
MKLRFPIAGHRVALVLLCALGCPHPRPQGPSLEAVRLSQAPDAQRAARIANASASPGSADFVRAFERSARGEPPPPRDLDQASTDDEPSGLTADPRYIGKIMESVDQDLPRIWRGTDDIADLFPDTVAVLGNGGLCTGILIGPDIVLTAAHCFCRGIKEAVIFGKDENGRKVLVDKTRSQSMIPCTAPLKLRNGDLAVLFLKSKVTTLPRRLANSAQISGATSFVAAGFGKTEDPVNRPVGIRRFVDVISVSNGCDGVVKIGGREEPDSEYYGCTAGREVIAGSSELDKDTCNGDSGGPLYVLAQDGQLSLAGVTSRPIAVTGSRPCGDGGVYGRVDGVAGTWLTGMGVHPND